MRAYFVETPNAPPRLGARPEPVAGPGQIMVKIAACGLNFADLLMMDGTYQDTPQAPFVLGMEVAGTVAAAGPDVSGFAPGDRVAVFSGQGGLAEVGVFDAARAIHVPDAMPLEEAAAFMIAYGTSHLALAHRANLQAGERLLVLGAAGGVGLTAVELGAAMGAEVIAVARGPEKLAVAKAAGATHLIDSDTGDIKAEVKALGGADVVYDAVGGAGFDAALRATRPEGRILTIGFASGTVPKIPANILLVKNISVIGLYWGGYMTFAPEKLTGSLAALMEMYVAGRIKPHISARVALADVGAAYEMLRARKSTGKIVVTI